MLILRKRMMQRNGTRDRSALDSWLQKTQRRNIRERERNFLSADKKKEDRQCLFNTIAKGLSQTQKAQERNVHSKELVD